MAKPVKVAVVGDASQLKRELDKASGTMQSFGDQAKSAAKNFVGAFAVAGFFKVGIDELKEAAAVSAQTSAALKSTGGAAGVTADHISDLAGSLSKLSGTDDEAIQASENLLLTFRNVRNEVGQGNDVFDQATRAALDLSTAGFGDLASTSKQLGKALNDPVRGVTQLNRVGVTFTKDQQETIRALTETGDVLGAQKIILEEVEKQVGGSAAAYGRSLPGAIDRAKESFNNTAGSVVAVFAPAMSALAAAAEVVFELFQKLPGPMQTAIVFAGLGYAAMKRFGASFDDLAIAAYDAVGKLEVFAASSVGGVTAGLVGIAAVSAGAAYGFTKLIDAVNGDPFGGFAENLERTDLALKELGSTGKVIGILADDLPKLAAGFKSTEAGASGWGETMLHVGSILPGIGGEVAKIGAGIDKGFDTDKLNKFRTDVDAIDKRLVELFHTDPSAATSAFDQLKNQLILMGAPADAVNAAFDDFATAQSDAAQASDTTTAALAAQSDAMKELNDQIRASVDPLFALRKSMRDNQGARDDLTGSQLALLGAQNAYNRAVADAGPNSAEAIEAAGALKGAQDKLTEAQTKTADTALDVTTAQNVLKGALADGTVTMEGAKTLLDQWVASGLISQDTANTLAGDFFGLAGAVGGVPDSKSTVVSAPGLEYVIDGFSRLAGSIYQSADATAYFNSVTGQGIVTKGAGIGTTITGHHATGGMLNEGWSWVGERGPELVNKRGGSVMVKSNPSSGMANRRPEVIQVVLNGKVIAETVRDVVRAGA